MPALYDSSLGEYIESSELNDAEFAELMADAARDPAHPNYDLALIWAEQQIPDFEELTPDQTAEWAQAVLQRPDHPAYELVEGVVGELETEGALDQDAAQWGLELAGSMNQLEQELGRPLKDWERHDIEEHAKHETADPPNARKSFEATKRDLTKTSERTKLAAEVSDRAYERAGAEPPEPAVGREGQPATKERREKALTVANAIMDGESEEASMEDQGEAAEAA